MKVLGFRVLPHSNVAGKFLVDVQVHLSCIQPCSEDGMEHTICHQSVHPIMDIGSGQVECASQALQRTIAQRAHN